MIIRSKAPLRLGLAGGGTDISPYCDEYGGYVLNVTINLYAYCTIEPTETGTIELISLDKGESFITKSTSYLDISDGLPLHKALYNRIISQYCSGKKLSFRMTTYSDAPPGSGLGSSSTMVVAMLKAYMEWLHLPLGEYEMAQLAYQVERQDLNFSGGKQDQYAATFGGFNFIEFGKNDQVLVNPLRLRNWIRNEFENMLILYYTGVSRDSAKIIDEQIKNTRSKNKNFIEAFHQLKESAFQMKQAILNANFDKVAECMNAGWAVKKKTASVISNSHIEKICDYIMKNGGKGVKVSGAGGGGFIIILCDPRYRYSLVQALKKTSGEVILTSLTEKGARSWVIYD